MEPFEIKGLGKRRIKDNIFTFFVWALTLSCLLVVFIILFYLFKMGLGSLNWALFSQGPKPVGETGGGILNAIVGSLIVVVLATIIAIPIGISVGIYLAENREKAF